MLERLIPAGLALIIILGLFATVAALIYLPLAQEISDVLKMLIGAVATMATTVVSFYFGSSAGSKRKTEVMANAARPGADA